LTAHQYYICDWVGFSFGLLSLILSLMTLYIIYLMCRKKKNTLEKTVQDTDRVENPMNVSMSNSDSSVNAATVHSTSTPKNNPSYTATVTSTGNGGDLKTTKFNGYLLLIASTAICQCLYDINYILGITNTYSGCLTWHFLDILGGMSVTLWTNILSFVIYYVVTYIQSVDIFHSYPYFFVVAVVFPLIVATLEVSFPGNLVKSDDGGCAETGHLYIFQDIYYWVRIGSILLNVVVFIVISLKLRRMAIYKPSSNNDDGESPSKQKRTFGTTLRRAGDVFDEPSAAIHALVRRMKYYPIVQVLVRSGSAWNEFDGYKYSSFTSQLLASICSPSTGAFYFLLFLYMQPKAFTIFCSLFYCGNPESSRPLHESNIDNTTINLRADSFNYNDLDEDELEHMIDVSSVARYGNNQNDQHIYSNSTDNGSGPERSRGSFSVTPESDFDSNKSNSFSSSFSAVSFIFSNSIHYRESEFSTKSSARKNNIELR